MKRFTAVFAVALTLAATIAGPWAAADPIADKKAQAARLAAQLEAKANAAEILTEQYNGARLKVGTAEADAAKAAKALAAAEVAAQRAESALKETAVQAYVHGGFLPLVQHAASPDEAVDLSVRRKYMNVVADRQADALSESRLAREDADRQRGLLEDARQASRQALAAADAKRKAAASAVGEQKALLDQVKGELASLVAAEQRRKAEAEARRVQAALAAPRGGSTSSGAPLLNRSTGTAPTNLPPPPNAGAATAVAEAKRQLGKPYEWAGAGPDTFDCSGLTAWAWKAAGKYLGHYTGSQYSATARVAIADLQPGDLVFFGSDLHHVGLYVGSGQMIHAPQTGDVVRYDSIYRSDLVQSGGRVY